MIFDPKSPLTGPVRKAAGLLLVLAAAGCGSGLIQPHGRIVKNGQPIKKGKMETLDVRFYTFAEGDQMPADILSADVTSNGRFRAVGVRRKGIPPGKYRIGVRILGGGDQDKLGGAFGPKNSPFIFDLTSDKEAIVLDIGKPGS